MSARLEANPTQSAAREIVAALVKRARAAQAAYERSSQEHRDEVATACGWAIMKPENNRALAELAVRDTGLGNVADKIAKNHRKTLGLLRDLQGVRTVGVIAEYPQRGVTEIARPVGVVAAITPSTNPGATPANQIINALKCGNAVVLAPSPKGYSTCALLLRYIHEEFTKIKADPDLVQVLPAPVTKEATHELMRQCDLIAATGSQSNIRAAYSSGTPAIGVGLGNVVSIVDASADLPAAAAKIALSKTFDHATSCSSENSAVILASVYDAMLEALIREGGVLLDAAEKAQLQKLMFPHGKLAAAATAQPAGQIARLAGIAREAPRAARFLMVAEEGCGPLHPFSGFTLSVYRRSFWAARRIVRGPNHCRMAVRRTTVRAEAVPGRWLAFRSSLKATGMISRPLTADKRSKEHAKVEARYISSPRSTKWRIQFCAMGERPSATYRIFISR